MARAHQALVCIFFLISPLLPLPSLTPSEAQKVSLDLYYEALCPYCSRFIVSSLSKIFSDGLISILDLRLVPFGNALVGSSSSISCQHGPSECFLNTVEACAIIAWPDVWTGLDSHPLVNCYNSGHGQEVELQYAAQTNALQPPHRYVPWVVVNGLPLYDDYENFEAHVCKAYNGELPNACRQQPLESYRPMKAGRASRGCIMNDTASAASAANRRTK